MLHSLPAALLGRAQARPSGDVIIIADCSGGVDPRAAPSIERRIAFLLDQAQGWLQRRDNAHVLLLLLEAEREAPEDMRYRPTGRQLIQHLVKRGRRSVAEQAAQMATRLALPI